MLKTWLFVHISWVQHFKDTWGQRKDRGHKLQTYMFFGVCICYFQVPTFSCNPNLHKHGNRKYLCLNLHVHVNVVTYKEEPQTLMVLSKEHDKRNWSQQRTDITTELCSDSVCTHCKVSRLHTYKQNRSNKGKWQEIPKSNIGMKKFLSYIKNQK